MYVGVCLVSTWYRHSLMESNSLVSGRCLSTSSFPRRATHRYHMAPLDQAVTNNVTQERRVQYVFDVAAGDICQDLPPPPSLEISPPPLPSSSFPSQR